MAKMQKRNLAKPDEARAFEKGKLELVTLGGVTFGRATLQPGWKWSTCVKPIVKTQSCEAPHLQYHVSGRIRVRMDDGSEDEFGKLVLSGIGQHGCVWLRHGTQTVVSPDSCTRQTASNKYTSRLISGAPR